MGDASQFVGLTRDQVKVRLLQFGYNELEERRFAAVFKNLIKILSDPMGLMLLILSFTYCILGESNDAVILLGACVPIMVVDVILELRSQKALRALKKSLKANCHVIREGRTQNIPIRELVPGDFLILEEGQTLPADGIILQAAHITIDESSLTGESFPIEKKIHEEAFSGTTVLTGNGILEIQKTGFSSELGKIAKVLQHFESTPSPLLKTVRKGVKVVFIVALAFALLVFIVGWMKNRGMGESLITALTLAMAAIPEEFPLVFTLYLSLAAYRLSKRGVLVKSLPAVEGLGRVDVICTDKTGTLTEGKFVLENIFESPASQSNDTLKLALVGACELKAIDAMEASILEWVEKHGNASEIVSIHQEWELEHDYPFDPREKYMSHIWLNRTTKQQFIAMKGALEGVLAHCEAQTDTKKILELAYQQAALGKRLLGLAYAEKKCFGSRIEDEKNLKFFGFLSFADPVRPSVPAAITQCQARGIHLKMLTGDHLLTAHSIADAIGLPHQHDKLFSGPDLEKLSLEERHAAYVRGTIFARLKPEQKLELVQALKTQGKIVAMTGDGINDAPALKLADVGISMGERATDVARSSAQIILLKNDFSGIVSSLLEGQNILKNLSESFGYLIAFHIPIILIALIQSFFLETLILKPIHIVLLELIVHPVSAFVFADAPRLQTIGRQDFLTKKRIFWSFLRGILLMFLCLGIFFNLPLSSAACSSAAVLMLVAGSIGLLMAESGGLWEVLLKGRRRALFAALILILVTVALAYVPLVSQIFAIETPKLSTIELVLSLGIALGALVPWRKNS